MVIGKAQVNSLPLNVHGDISVGLIEFPPCN
jgi:hypothetical protein